MFLQYIRNIIADPHCVFCDKLLDVRANHLICEECSTKLPFASGRVCSICHVPLDTTYGELICHNCKDMKNYFIKNVSRYLYKDLVRDAILRMKFGNSQIWISSELGKFLSQTIKQEYDGINFDMVIYVPLSQIKEYTRKFNQSREIAFAVSKQCGIRLMDDILIKTRNTKSQSSLSLGERKDNVKGVYKVTDQNAVIDKTILLVDDVYTTGATLNECAKTLKKSGALAIYTSTVAITKHE